MHQALLHFPEIQLTARDGHKLRGYFAQCFGQDSDLWHNHQANGKVIYRYPLIQYKVVDGAAILLGLEEGAALVMRRFLTIRELDINGRKYPVRAKNLEKLEVEAKVHDALYDYTFTHPWMALNQKNYKLYTNLSVAERQPYLEKMLRNNILAFFKGIDHFEEQQIQVKLRQLRQVPIQFKNEHMSGFLGDFTTNAQLPNYIGLGKSVSRGFGTIHQIN